MNVITILYILFQIQTSQLRNLTTELTLLKQQVESQEEKHWSEITKMKAEHEQTVRYFINFLNKQRKLGGNKMFFQCNKARLDHLY